LWKGSKRNLRGVRQRFMSSARSCPRWTDPYQVGYQYRLCNLLQCLWDAQMLRLQAWMEVNGTQCL